MTVALVAALAIWGIWFGYPLAIAALAALRRPRLVAPASPPPTVTVVIATRDDPGVVRRRVTDALAAVYPAELLTVVVGLDAGGSLTSSADLAGLDRRLVAVAGDQPGGKAATLNAAVRAATGDVLVFTDAGQAFEPAAIGRLVNTLCSDSALGAASGRLEIPAGSDGPSLAERYWRFERWVRRSEARVHSTIGVTGAIYAMRRALWSPLPAGIILDDLYVPMHLVLRGYRIGFVDDARATDTRRFATGQEFRRKVRTLTGVIQLCVWLPGVLHPLRNPVWVQFVCHKLLRLLTPYLALLAAVGATVAAAARFGRTFFLGVLALALVGALVALLRPSLGRRVRDTLVSAVAMQGAVVAATANGLRGRWDVWQQRP